MSDKQAQIQHTKPMSGLALGLFVLLQAVAVQSEVTRLELGARLEAGQNSYIWINYVFSAAIGAQLTCKDAETICDVNCPVPEGAKLSDLLSDLAKSPVQQLLFSKDNASCKETCKNAARLLKSSGGDDCQHRPKA